MGDYRISVVVPNYNNQTYLRECVESIQRQSYPIEEIIVVDDCSSDDSVNVLTQLQKEYSNLTVVALKENGKVSHARNTGLSKVHTPYVSFMDADDIYYNPDKIKNEMALVRKYKEEKNQDIIAYSHIAIIAEDGQLQYINQYDSKYYQQGNIYESVLTSKYFFTIMRDFCMPTAVIKAIGGYNEKNSLYEDLELILKLSQRLEFYYTGETGTGYRQVQAGLSSKPKEVHQRKKKEIFEAELVSVPGWKKAWYRIERRLHIQQTWLLNWKWRIVRKVKKLL